MDKAAIIDAIMFLEYRTVREISEISGETKANVRKVLNQLGEDIIRQGNKYKYYNAE